MSAVTGCALSVRRSWREKTEQKCDEADDCQPEFMRFLSHVDLI
jgi:hypothetical protein